MRPKRILTPIALIPYAVMAAAMAGGLLWHLGDRIGGLAPVEDAAAVPIGGPFHLIDQNGKAVSDEDFRGRYMLVYFGYTHCPDVCPITLSVMANAMGKLGPLAARVVPVFITVDPQRDTPKAMKDYLAAFGPRFIGLTGSLAAVKIAAGEYHVFFRKHAEPGGGYSVDHSSTIYLMGPNGRFVTYYDETKGPGGIAADLRKRI